MLSAKTYRPCVVGALAALLLLLSCAAWAADPEEKAPPAAWPTSPFLGAVDGVTGVPIPWLCRSGGSVYRLGDTVCMSTHLGVQMARCDLVLNNTPWVPIGVPCTLMGPRRPAPTELRSHDDRAHEWLQPEICGVRARQAGIAKRDAGFHGRCAGGARPAQLSNKERRPAEGNRAPWGTSLACLHGQA